MAGNCVLIESKYNTYDGSLDSNYLTWLRGFEAWANAIGLDGEGKCRHFSHYLKCTAATAYHGWDDAVKRDWDQLRRTFLAYGGRPERKKLWTTEILNTKHEQFSSVDLYIDKMTDLGQKLQLSDQDIMTYLINNLSRPLYTAMLPISCDDLTDAILKIKMLDRGGIASDRDPRIKRAKPDENENSAKLDTQGESEMEKHMKSLQQAFNEYREDIVKLREEMIEQSKADKRKLNDHNMSQGQPKISGVSYVHDVAHPPYACNYVNPSQHYYDGYYEGYDYDGYDYETPYAPSQPTVPPYDGVMQAQNTTDPYISVWMPNPNYQPPY